MGQVTFKYDEPTGKWECEVSGVEDATEARQAFSAVVITCAQLNQDFLRYTKVETFFAAEEPFMRYRIEPAV